MVTNDKEKRREGFICDKCGYKAYQKAKYSDCPLCLICKRCKKRTEDCECIEGE